MRMKSRLLLAVILASGLFAAANFAQEKGASEICNDNKQIRFFVCNEASGARYRGPLRKLNI